ncbi:MULTISPECIES: hypothetical protein [unclassified Prochlorococcus]|uniref:hypothetical protein n=1 Tax=unclassified Prochlorococcus TaxID=2627481 RepID=UPI00055D66F6|nr:MULTISPECIES: hypothetical protein [unclassified Prochlorococcus]
MLKKNTFLSKERFYRTKLLAYLQSKGVETNKQITNNTFDDYIMFRNTSSSPPTKMVLAGEITKINEWANKFLLRNKYIEADMLLDNRGFLKQVKVTQKDRDANPAINSEDWRKIIDYVRDIWRHECIPPLDYLEAPDKRTYSDLEPDRRQWARWKRVWFYRTLFWHFILLAKNTGMSPEEVLKLKWKNIEIKDVGRLSQSKAKQEIEEIISEAQAEGKEIDIEEPEATDPSEWVSNPNTCGREERLVAFIFTTRAKTQQSREIPCNQGKELKRWMQFVKDHVAENNLDMNITGDSYVFASPYNEENDSPHYTSLSLSWREIRSALKDQLKGHKFTDKPYTLYSLRSTFIEDHLLKGTDLFLLARIAGHDVKELMRSYERIDIRKRAREITSINYGKKGETYEDINLLEIEPTTER